MKISKTGLQLIEQFEGCRLTAYQDVVGVWTIGYGHTKKVKKGDVITREQAEHFLMKDVEKAENNVNSFYGRYKWNQNQFDALVSFAFNLGSINQLTANGTRTISQISEKILAYNKAGGKVVNGLTRRRQAEKRLFDTVIAQKAENGANTKPQEVSMMNGVKLPTLKKGSKGRAVKVWQIILNLDNTQVDGVFGAYTQERTIEFQAIHGLSKDGVVGDKSWEVGLKTLWAEV